MGQDTQGQGKRMDRLWDYVNQVEMFGLLGPGA